QDPRRNQMQHGLLAADHERVPGVVPALEAHHALRMVGEPVDDLALALVAPLGAYDYDVLAHCLDFPHHPLAAALHELAIAFRRHRLGGVPRQPRYHDLAGTPPL